MGTERKNLTRRTTQTAKPATEGNPVLWLCKLRDALAPGCSVTLTRDALAAVLGDAPPVQAQAGGLPPADLTVTELARRYGKSEGTVRGWIRSGLLEAYVCGNGYRATPDAARAFDEARRTAGAGKGAARRARGAVPVSRDEDLGSWRQVRPPAI